MLETKNENKSYVIDEVQRISLRYYLIKIGQRSYVMDFSNPRDVKNYFGIFFPSGYKRWKIYDVTNNEDKYEGSSVGGDHDPKYFWVPIVVVGFYLINRGFFPLQLKLQYLTLDWRISAYWGFTLLAVFGIALIICWALCDQEIDLELPEKCQELVREQTHEMTRKQKISLYLVIPFIMVVALFIGIGSDNYADLVFFVGGGIYPWVFMKFGIFLNPTNKYFILDEEGNALNALSMNDTDDVEIKAEKIAKLEEDERKQRRIIIIICGIIGGLSAFIFSR